MTQKRKLDHSGIQKLDGMFPKEHSRPFGALGG